MDQTEFLETVNERIDGEERGGIHDETAMDTTRAVLSTLGERLSEDQATDLAAQLPGDLSSPLTDGESGRRFPKSEFVARVDQRLEADELSGENVSPTVMGVVLEHVDASERAAIVDQFEHIGFEELLEETNAEVDVQDRSPRES